MKNLTLAILILVSLHSFSQVKISATSTYPENIKIVDVKNIDDETEITLEFYYEESTSGTLHAPSGDSPFVLSDKKGNRYALKSQLGWGGDLDGGFGRVTLTAFESKTVKLYFAQVKDINNIYSLTEVDCDSEYCWNFYEIKIEHIEIEASLVETWVEVDVFDSIDDFGMKIHTKFNVNNMKGEKGYLTVRFMDDGNFVLTDDEYKRNELNQIELRHSIIPAYEKTVYNDVIIFVPYRVFNFPIGKHSLKYDLDVYKEDGSLITHLELVDYEFIRR